LLERIPQRIQSGVNASRGATPHGTAMQDTASGVKQPLAYYAYTATAVANIDGAG